MSWNYFIGFYHCQRHNIAYGQPSNMGAAAVYQYYDDIKQIVVFLDREKGERHKSEI